MHKLLYIIGGVLLFVSISDINAQTLRSPDPDDFRIFTRHYIAPFKLVGQAPQNIEEFVRFSVEYLPGQENNEDKLTPDTKRQVPVKGFVLIKTESSSKTGKGKIVRFEVSKIILSENSIKLSFKTKKFKNVYYIFEGEYFDTGIVYPEKDSTRLEGTLAKMKNGTKLADAKLSFYPNIADVD